MRQLHYVNAQIIVSDIVCTSVLRYARALTRAGSSDIVSIPFRLHTGVRAEAQLVLGPASQLFSTPADEPTPDPTDDASDMEATEVEMRVAQGLERLTTRLQPSRPAWPAETSEMVDLDPDFDLDY